MIALFQCGVIEYVEDERDGSATYGIGLKLYGKEFPVSPTRFTTPEAAVADFAERLQALYQPQLREE